MTNNHDWDSSTEPSYCCIHEHQVECVRACFLFFCYWRRGICVEVKRCVEKIQRRCLRGIAGRTELLFISHAIPHPDLRRYFISLNRRIFQQRHVFMFFFERSILKQKFALCSSVLLYVMVAAAAAIGCVQSCLEFYLSPVNPVLTNRHPFPVPGLISPLLFQT